MDETLTPEEAVREVRALAGFEETLRMRVEGLTWMLLGLVLACTFLAYAFATLTNADDWVFLVLWIPWLTMGLAIAWGIRRALSLSTRGPEWWLFALVGGAFLAGVVVFLAGAGDAAPMVALLAASLLALAPALAPRLGYSAIGKRVGTALAFVGIGSIAILVLTGGDDLAATIASSFVAGCWVVGGIYEVLQG